MAPALWHYMSYWKTMLTIRQIWRQGDKNLKMGKIGENLKVQSRLFKNSNFLSLLWIGDQILNLWMNEEKLCPKFSFIVENKMDNSHEKEWSHFKLIIDDWDIPFSKILRIYQWIKKNIFHWGKWNETIGNSARTTKHLAERPWKKLFLAYVYKSISLVNEL